MTGENGLADKPMLVDEALKADLWQVEGSPHITVDLDRCVKCESKPCIRLCPAECFTMVGERVLFSYEWCLECGTCRIVCSKGSIKWNLPRSGNGIQYRFT